MDFFGSQVIYCEPELGRETMQVYGNRDSSVYRLKQRTTFAVCALSKEPNCSFLNTGEPWGSEFQFTVPNICAEFASAL